MQNALVICIGNPFRGDDAVGLLVADGLADAMPQLHVVRHTGDGAALIDVWDGSEHVILIDAVVSGALPGMIHQLDARSPLKREWFSTSTHAFNVSEAIELARLLGRLPSRLVVIGIEGCSFGIGACVSPEVTRAVDRVVRRLPDIVQDIAGGRPVNAPAENARA